MSAFVYFIRPVGQVGPIKIGYSRNPVTRLSSLMRWSPVDLEIILMIPGTLHTERDLHGLFAHDHVRREWFRPSVALLHLIDRLQGGENLADVVAFPRRAKSLYDRKRNEDVLLRRSYYARLYNTLGYYAGHSIPDDLLGIMRRWSGLPKQTSQRPTDDEFAALEKAIANAPAHLRCSTHTAFRRYQSRKLAASGVAA